MQNLIEHRNESASLNDFKIFLDYSDLNTIEITVALNYYITENHVKEYRRTEKIVLTHNSDRYKLEMLKVISNLCFEIKYTIENEKHLHNPPQTVLDSFLANKEE